MGALDKIFLNGTKLEVVWNQIRKNFYPTSPDNTGDVAITFTKDSNGIVTGVTTTIGAGKVTNAMLAGSIANSKLANSKITINGNDISLGTNVALNTFIGYLSPNANNGVVQLSGGKIPLSVIPDAILGQLIYGGTVNGTGVVSLSDNAKAKWGITSLTLTSTNYADYQGAFFIASANGSSGVPSSLGVKVGDWIVATSAAWKKIDNTDAVTGVKGDAETEYRIGNVNITKANIGLGNVGNFKAVSTVASQGLTSTEQSNARANIGLGTAATHAHGDYVTAITWDSTNRKLQQSKGGAAATDIVQFGTAALKAYTDSSSASAISTSTNLVTERDVYYGLPTINNAHNYTSSSTFYAPTTGGTAGYVLIGDGTTSAPVWTNKIFVDTTNNRVGINTTSPSQTLSVSGTAGITGNTTIGGTLDVTGVATFNSNVRLPYTSTVKIKDSGGTYRDILAFNSNSRLVFGMGTAQAGYDTFIGGKNVVIQTGTTPATEGTFSTAGLSMVHDIKSTTGDIFALAGGLAAYGIADLDMGAGGGGTGTVTSIKFGNASQIDSVDGLLTVPVGQGGSNGTISIGGAEIAVKGLGSLAYLNTVPIATSGAIGGIKIGFTTDAANRNYAVALSSEHAYVNVPWTDTKVTSVANHYTPTSESYTPTSGSWTWGSTQVVTGITKDSKGHIVGVTTTSIANPNSNTWREVYVGGTSSVGTGINTKAVNYKAGTNLSVSFQAAGTGSGQSGSADYFNVVFSHATSGATAGSYGDSAAQTPAFGGTIKVPYVTIDAQGHVTGISAHNVTIPATMATDSKLGLVKVGSTLAISSGVLNQKSGIVTAGTYHKVTVDTYGRVTAGSNPTTIAGYSITDAKLEHANGTAGTNTVHKITLGDKVLYIYFNSAETTDTDNNKLGSFDITISDKADPSASDANTKTFSFGTLTKAQIESICTL